MTFGPSIYYEAQFRIAQARGIQYTVAEVPPRRSPASGGGTIRGVDRGEEGGLSAVLADPREQVLIPKDTQFSIVIPKIGASAKVFPNINSSDQEEFLPILQQGVAHAKGTVFPGQKGNVYLFAHSTDNFWDVGRYNAIFYLLKDLAIGDDVVIFFENLRHNYKVVESKIVDAEDVSYIVDSQKKGEEQLILQTCWPPGTTWKRLIVIAEPK